MKKSQAISVETNKKGMSKNNAISSTIIGAIKAPVPSESKGSVIPPPIKFPMDKPCDPL